MKIFKIIARILLKIIFISAALVLFFSMMAGMYYKNGPRHIKTAVVDLDHSALSRSIINNVKTSTFYDITKIAVDYNSLKKMIAKGDVHFGIMIPENTYKEVLNKRSVRILAVADGTINPSISNMAVLMLNKIIMTLNMQLSMHMRIEDLGTVPNVRHAKKPILSVSSRFFYNPYMNMERSMLPAFMGLAMQIVSMLIVLFGIMDALKKGYKKMPYIKQARQLPPKMLISPLIVSWIIVSSSISIAFFIVMNVMNIFNVTYDSMVMWDTIAIISLFVLTMQSISYFLALNIKNPRILAAIITLIVFPAFMYSGFLIPKLQLAFWPNLIGRWFPLRYYLEALFPTFTHHQPLSMVGNQLNTLWNHVFVFIGLSILSIIIGQIERKFKMKKPAKATVKDTEN